MPSSMTVKEKPGEIQVGDMVKVKRGFLKGRRGTVQEIGERGMLKIGFGPLSSRIDVTDVVGLEMIPADYSRSNKSSGRGEKENNPR
jgi:ribosomal protein L24